MPLPPFQPTEANLPRLIDDLSSPDLTLTEVAQRHDTTLETLALYLTSPASLFHIATLELAAALRIRLAAQALIPRAIQALSTMLEGYADDADRITIRDTEATIPLREQQRQNARRASHLLFRLAHFTPRPLAGLSRFSLTRAAAPRTSDPHATGANGSSVQVGVDTPPTPNRNSSLSRTSGSVGAVSPSVSTGGDGFTSHPFTNSQTPPASSAPAAPTHAPGRSAAPFHHPTHSTATSPQCHTQTTPGANPRPLNSLPPITIPPPPTMIRPGPSTQDRRNAISNVI